MENIDTYKEKLLAEKKVLEGELSHLGRINPDNPDDWEAKPGEAPQAQADKNEMADRLEDFEQVRSTEVQLELRLNEVKAALVKIEEGTFGTCEVDGKPIEEKRLKANPAARTCIEHTK